MLCMDREYLQFHKIHKADSPFHLSEENSLPHMLQVWLQNQVCLYHLAKINHDVNIRAVLSMIHKGTMTTFTTRKH